jgi:hypothetical protein
MQKVKQRCKHCQQSFIPARNPRQKYCYQRTCQTARKRDWRKQKRCLDSDYRENQQRVNQKWYRSNPDYWRQYRSTHQSYTDRNREQQRWRDKQRKEVRANRVSLFANPTTSPLAKSDALGAKTALEAIKSGTYRLIPVGDADLAKSDALTVRLSCISMD